MVASYGIRHIFFESVEQKQFSMLENGPASALLEESAKHKQGRSDGEEREKLSTTGFMDREQRYTREIRQTEDFV